MRIHSLFTGSLAAVLLLATSSSVQAAGFYIQEQSVRGLGYAFSGSTTSIDDASTIYFNPAGMTKLDRAQINAGAHFIYPDSDLSDTGTTAPPGQPVGPESDNPYKITPVPNLYGAMPITDQLWLGLGVSAPFGLGSDYDDGWFGRYDSTETELKTINVAPSLALKATEWLSIGLGIDIQYADAVLESAAFAGAAGTSRLSGDDWSVGYNAGIQIKPWQHTEIGLHYRSAMKHTLDGTISAEGTGAGDFTTGGTADLNLPDIATLGIAHDVTPQTRLMAQATWFGWNNFQDIAAIDDSGTVRSRIVQNYQTTWAFAVGAEHDLNDKWTVRAGYQYDETPTTDLYRTSRTPDGDRNWFSLGATHKLTENMDLDFAATYIHVGDETINVSRNAGLANIQADTEGQVGIVAVGLTFKF
jgi:long-chain fatty acid transport protein